MRVDSQGSSVRGGLRRRTSQTPACTQPCYRSGECRPFSPHSSSLSSSESLSSLAAFLVAFFFFLFLDLPAFLDNGCSRILRISSSLIFLSDLTLLKSSGGGPPSLVMPFFVMAAHRLAKYQRND